MYCKDALKEKLGRKVMVTFLSFKLCSAILNTRTDSTS